MISIKFSFLFFFLIIIKNIISGLRKNEDDFKCDYDKPLFNTESSTCVNEAFNGNKHQISNEIIKIQWLNRINQIGRETNWYMGFDLSSKGDLIIQSVRFTGRLVTERDFYGITSTGRPFFYDKNEDKFTNEVMITSRTDYKKVEAEFIKIRLIGDDENDYFISTTILNGTTELIDLKNKEIFGVYQGLLFGNVDIYSFRYSIFELSSIPKTYMFCFIVDYQSTYYLSLQKFQFFKTDLYLDNSFIKLESTSREEKFKVYKSKMISCIEIAKYFIIQCFYLDLSQYLYLGLFTENNVDFKYSEKVEDNLITEVSDGYQGFFKCIYLFKEISVLSYVLKNEEGNYNIYIQIKNLIYNYKREKYFIEDFLVRYKRIELKKEIPIVNSNFYIFDLIKINNKKFSIVAWNEREKKIYIIIFQLYKIHETNLFIKYYSINLALSGITIYKYLKSLTYNNFLGLVVTINKDPDKRYQYFSLISYINGTDSTLNTNLHVETKLNLSEYINKIENNIFGVVLKGIKILKLPKSGEIGIYFLSLELNNEIINENDILPNNDSIIFVYDYENLNRGNDIYTIEFAGIVEEQTYNEDEKFTLYREFYGNESYENYYFQNIYIGRTSFYNFTINNDLNGLNVKSCCEHCKVCYSGKCIHCEDNYYLILDKNKCEKEFNEFGYYYDSDNSVYKNCHRFCKSCNKGPKYYVDLLEIEDTNCIECIDNYYKLENTNNCVSKDDPPLYHYFNKTENKFLKCSENCLTCNQSQINDTYFGCTSCDEISILYPQSTNCLNCFARDRYINPYFNECLFEVEEGYYLKDPINKLVDICYHSCKACDIKGNETNHQCLSCNEDYSFNYKNIKCIDDCSKYDLYSEIDIKRCFINCAENNYTNKIFGFNYECYETCPNGTKLDENRTQENICICKGLYYKEGKKIICLNGDNCPENYPLRKQNINECYQECKTIYKLECYSYCPENTFAYNIYDLIICLDIMNETMTLDKLNLDEFSIFSIVDVPFNEKLNNIIANCYEGITINIYPNILNIYDIPPKFSNLTFIDLDKCGEELKKYYHLEKNEILYIISAEAENKISNRLTNEFIFSVYLKNGTQLQNLSICNSNNAYFSVTSKLSNLDLANFDAAEKLYKQGYNIYNLESEFYTDGCSPANLDSNDIALKDRKLIYPPNISFCPEDCNFLGVKIEDKRVRCSCDVNYTEEYINFTTNFIKVEADDNFFTYLADNLNYRIFKCYHILLNLHYNNLFNNIGFYIGFFAFVINLFCILVFSFCTLNLIRLEIYKSIPNRNKLKEALNNNKPKKNIRRSNKNKKGKNKLNKNRVIKNLDKNKNINIIKQNNNKSQNNSLMTKSTVKSWIKKEFDVDSENSENFLDEEGIIKDIEYNVLPYTVALRKDRRNFMETLISIFKLKIEIISLIFYPEEFTYKSYTLSMYFLDFIFGYFTNAMLYSDDVVSEKYHNNGKLNLLTSIFMSLTSNIVSWIVACLSKNIFIYKDSLLLLIKEVKRKYDYILTFKKLYLVLKLKSFCYYSLSFIFIIIMTYYLMIFCLVYHESQTSLMLNFIMSIVESLITSICISFIITSLRKLGLKCKIKYLYRTSIFLDQKI